MSGDGVAMDLAEEQSDITKWFYDCSVDTHVGLGRMYVVDERFRRNIDKAGAGLADYLSAATIATTSDLSGPSSWA